MNTLAQAIQEIKLEGNEVSVDELGNLLNMMKNQSISSLSVPELVQHLSTMKMKDDSPERQTSRAPSATPQPRSVPSLASSFGVSDSPEFSFQSPSNVFTPFKGKSGQAGKQIAQTVPNSAAGPVKSPFVFNVDAVSVGETEQVGPFSTNFVADGHQPKGGANATQPIRPSTADSMGNVFQPSNLMAHGTTIGTGSSDTGGGFTFNTGSSIGSRPSTAGTVSSSRQHRSVYKPRVGRSNNNINNNNANLALAGNSGDDAKLNNRPLSAHGSIESTAVNGDNVSSASFSTFQRTGSNSLNPSGFISSDADTAPSGSGATTTPPESWFWGSTGNGTTNGISAGNAGIPAVAASASTTGGTYGFALGSADATGKAKTASNSTSTSGSTSAAGGGGSRSRSAYNRSASVRASTHRHPQQQQQQQKQEQKKEPPPLSTQQLAQDWAMWREQLHQQHNLKPDQAVDGYESVSMDEADSPNKPTPFSSFTMGVGLDAEDEDDDDEGGVRAAAGAGINAASSTTTTSSVNIAAASTVEDKRTSLHKFAQDVFGENYEKAGDSIGGNTNFERELAMGSADLLDSFKPQLVQDQYKHRGSQIPQSVPEPQGAKEEAARSTNKGQTVVGGEEGDEKELNFTVYSLGDNDILQSLNESSSSSSRSSSAASPIDRSGSADVPRSTSTQQQPPPPQHQKEKDAEDAEDTLPFLSDDDDEMMSAGFERPLHPASDSTATAAASPSATLNTRGSSSPSASTGNVSQHPASSSSFSATMESTATKSTVLGSIGGGGQTVDDEEEEDVEVLYPTSGGAGTNTHDASMAGAASSFLFDGASMAASMAQLEKENLNTFDTSNVSSGKANAFSASTCPTTADTTFGNGTAASGGSANTNDGGFMPNLSSAFEQLNVSSQNPFTFSIGKKDSSTTTASSMGGGGPGSARKSTAAGSAGRKTSSPGNKLKSKPSANTTNTSGTTGTTTGNGVSGLPKDVPPLWWSEATIGNDSSKGNSNIPAPPPATARSTTTTATANRTACGDGELLSDSEDETDDDEFTPKDMQGKNPSKPASTSKQAGSSKASGHSTENATVPPRAEQQKQQQQSDASLGHLAELYSKQGKDLYSSGSYLRALDAYNKCLNLGPANWLERPTALGNRAAVLVMLHRFVEAVNDCEEALKLDKNMVKLHVRRGRALLRLGHFTPAEEAFKQVGQFHVRDLLTPREALDDELLHNTQEILEGNRSNARLGLSDLVKLRENIRTLIVYEGQSKFKEALKIADDILKLSPYYRAAHISKATALCETLQYDEAKEYIEKLTSNTHASIQTFHAHSSAALPCVAPALLAWKVNAAEKNIRMDIPIIAGFLLCAGAEMAQVYVNALKNVSLNRLYSADVMSKLATLLKVLMGKLTVPDLLDTWSWVQAENDKIHCLLSLKISADEKFKANNFRGAQLAYSNAIKVDATARKWNAIIHSNRAATLMSLGLFSDAVQDCHHAIQKDPDFSKAYLRRARAYRSLNKQAECTRDYRRYLSSEPRPVDFKAVTAELNEYLDERRRQQSKYQQESSSRRSGGTGHSTNPHNFSSYSHYSGYARPGSATGGTGTSSSAAPGGGGGGRSGSTQWGNSEEDPTDRFAYFKQNHRTAAGGPGAQQARGGTTSSSTGGRRSAYGQQNASASANASKNSSQHRDYYNFLESDEEDDDDDDDYYYRSYYQRQNQQQQRTGTGYSSGANRGTSSSSQHTGGSSGGRQGHQSSSSSSSSSRHATGSAADTGKSHYTELGISASASEKDIKMAYRKLALKFHPDKNKDPGAEEKFKSISTAYATLSDKSARRQYDLSRPAPNGGRYRK